MKVEMLVTPIVMHANAFVYSSHEVVLASSGMGFS